MGLDYRATTVIGYRVSTENCHYREVIKNCQHDMPEDSKFCPTCGRKVGAASVRRRKDEFDDFMYEFANNQLPFGYVCEQHYDGAGDEFWIGYGSRVDMAGQAELKPKPYEEIKQELAHLLAKFTASGLFELEEQDFGIWTLYTAA